jgi:hypothetical protein
MTDDGFAKWYADRIWLRMPAIYRAMDVGPTPTAAGPLRELVNRIGAQAAVVRRSMDRLAENQSIETCDDWVIPYIGDLLATRIISYLDARAQRIDVAKTIYYRRRAGTVGLLEELANDIAGRNARVVEFFRRMARTRHQFDPPLSDSLASDPISDRALSVAQDLRGTYTDTPAGGFADLRNVYGASNTGSAFDEYAYTADLRAGSHSTGWYNISHLGIFLWWLYPLNIAGATPVSNGAASPCFTFDPTGRNIQLFAASPRTTSANNKSWGEDWISPSEYELPVPIRESLWIEEPVHLYPASFSVGLAAAGTSAPVDPGTVTIYPETGRFSFKNLPGGNITSTFDYGFSSRIGACGLVAANLAALNKPATTNLIKAADPTPVSTLQTALSAITADVSIQIDNSITFTNLASTIALHAASIVILRAITGERPVFRWDGKAGTQFTIQGSSDPTAPTTLFVLQGLYIQGADIVLTGNFETVDLRMMTLDPGTSGVAPNFFATAIDGVPLRPTTLYIEGSVANLKIESSITGPIRTRNGGAVETLTVSDSIIQSIPTHTPVATSPADLALDFSEGSVSLSRTTVMGPMVVHKLCASECILDDIATVDNAQQGCVRFTSYAMGSTLHQPYRCVVTSPVPSIFETRIYGRPEFARLREDADNAILIPSPESSILEGAQNTSEMGAFSLERVSLLKRGLALKYEEFMPIGQVPVWIDVNE